MNDVIQAIQLYLMDNRDALLSSISPTISQYKDLLKTEDHAFHDEITKQFEVLIRRELAEEVATSLSLDPEQVFLVVEGLDVQDFIS